ncbi:MAG: GIY-YIG nuclease family protein [Bacteroidaceae bacterium]|nr:GIY-YIG nuclease family protein [Bacteroidaceae bacterium]
MPGLVKIGMTVRDDLQKRLYELYTTGVPVPFKAVHASKVKKEDTRRIEQALHIAFAPNRVNPRREFFHMEAERVIAMLKVIEIEDVTDFTNKIIRQNLDPSELEAQTLATEEREREEREQKKRRPTLNYHDLGIQDGDRLFWKDNQEVYVTVSGERKVSYKGEDYSLTAVTQKLKDTTKPIAPAPYWLFEGKSLIDIYNDKYSPIDTENV